MVHFTNILINMQEKTSNLVSRGLFGTFSAASEFLLISLDCSISEDENNLVRNIGLFFLFRS